MSWNTEICNNKLIEIVASKLAWARDELNHDIRSPFLWFKVAGFDPVWTQPVNINKFPKVARKLESLLRANDCMSEISENLFLVYDVDGVKQGSISLYVAALVRNIGSLLHFQCEDKILYLIKTTNLSSGTSTAILCLNLIEPISHWYSSPIGRVLIPKFLSYGSH